MPIEYLFIAVYFTGFGFFFGEVTETLRAWKRFSPTDLLYCIFWPVLLILSPFTRYIYRRWKYPNGTKR